MLRTRSMFVLFAVLASPAFAALEPAQSTASSESSAPKSRKNTILTVETIGVYSGIAMDASASAGGYRSSTSDSVSGVKPIGGVAVGGTFMTSPNVGLEVNSGVLVKRIDEDDQATEMLTTRLSGLARFYPTSGFSIGAGLYSSLFVGDMRVKDGDGETRNVKYSDSGFNRFDYGMVLGARGEIPLSKAVAFTVDARYFHGFQNLVDQDKVAESIPSGVEEFSIGAHTRDVQFGAGVAFAF